MRPDIVDAVAQAVNRANGHTDTSPVETDVVLQTLQYEVERIEQQIQRSNKFAVDLRNQLADAERSVTGWEQDAATMRSAIEDRKRKLGRSS